MVLAARRISVVQRANQVSASMTGESLDLVAQMKKSPAMKSVQTTPAIRSCQSAVSPGQVAAVRWGVGAGALGR